MKALVLSLNYLPEGGSAASKMHNLAHKLLERGHRVSVVTEMPNYPQGVIHEEYKGKLFTASDEEGVSVYRTWVYASKERQRFLPRFFNYVSFMMTSIFGGLRAGRQDIIYVYSPPPLLGITATLLGKLYGCPYILMVNDLWPRAAIVLGFIRKRWMIALAEAMESFVYHHAERVFVYSEKMAGEIRSAGVAEEKIEVHPLWIDTSAFRPVESTEDFRERFDFNGSFTVMYAGIMSFAQGIDNLIQAANLLKDEDISFVLVGGGGEKENLEEMARSFGLRNVRFIGQQPMAMMPSFFSNADVLFVHLNKAPHRVGTIPEKALAYMSCGKPVLMGAEGAAADLVMENDCGIAVEPQNPQDIATAILRLFRDEPLRIRLGENARHAALHRFDKDLLLEKMEKRLREIASDFKDHR